MKNKVVVMSTTTEKVNVSEDNWRRLNAMKKPGDTFNDVVDRLLDEQGIELPESSDE